MPQELALKVKETVPRTYNVKSFRLQLNGPVEFKAGQFMKVILQEGKDYEHYLSFSNSPTEAGFIEFTKKISESLFSKRLCGLMPGDTVKVQLPFGKFTLEGSEKKIAFLSGGIGITPARSIIKYTVDKNLDLDMVLVYANRTIKDIVFRDDFESMQEINTKLKIVHVLSEPASGFKSITGLINAQIVSNEIPDYPERKFYLCGPPQMVEAMRKILSEELKVASEQIVTENFQGY